MFRSRALLLTSLASLLPPVVLLVGCTSTVEEPTEATEAELVGLARVDVVAALGYGQSVEVPSSPNRRYRGVKFVGAAGDSVAIDVRSAGDARAWLLGPDFRKTLTSNDDASATTKNARITFTLTADGEHTIAFREASNTPTTFTVALAKTNVDVPAGGNDVCGRHPWPLAYGCRDRQGRSSGTGPTTPTIAWQTQLASPCAIEHLLVDAAGTAYVSQDSCQDTFLHARGGRFSAVRADGSIAWSTSLVGRLRSLAIGGDDALYGYVMGRRALGGWTSAVVHAFYRFDPTTGAATTLFSEEIGSDQLPREITPLPDGRIQFSVPANPSEYPAQATPSAKLYDPATGTLTDATTAVTTPWLVTALADGGTLTSQTTYDDAVGRRLYWVERKDAAGLLLWRTDDAQLLGVGPGGSALAVSTDRWGSSSNGVPSRLAANGTLGIFAAAGNKTASPWRMAIGADDSLVVTHDWYEGSTEKKTLAKYRKDGSLVFEAPVPLDHGNIAIDVNGNIYGGGAAFGPSGTRLEAPGRPWVPSLDRIAVGPGGTLYAGWSLPNASGTLYKLANATP